MAINELLGVGDADSGDAETDDAGTDDADTLATPALTFDGALEQPTPTIAVRPMAIARPHIRTRGANTGAPYWKACYDG
jgi:hypothetical protein